MKLNHVYFGDCIEVMDREIGEAVVDLIYADPPYNLAGKPLDLVNNKTGGPYYKMNEEWDQWEAGEYFAFTNAWVAKAKAVLKPYGSLYISCTFHSIGEIIIAAKNAGLKLNNIITWFKPNAMPNITKRTYTHATEQICWFVKGEKWKFNYTRLKELNPHRTKEGRPKQMRDFIDFVELPLLQGKERIKTETGRALHPTQKPAKLLEIIISASSDEGDIILDPFLGTGTTAVVAERMNRKWIGIEINELYYETALKRIRGAL